MLNILDVYQQNIQNYGKIKEPICENRYVTVLKLANELEISFGKCRSVLTVDLNIEKNAAKFMPQLQVIKCRFTGMARKQSHRRRVHHLCTQIRPDKVIPLHSAC